MNWYRRMFKYQGPQEEWLKVVKNPSSSQSMKLNALDQMQKHPPSAAVMEELLALYQASVSTSTLIRKLNATMVALAAKMKETELSPYLSRIWELARQDDDLLRALGNLGSKATPLLPAMYEFKDDVHGPQELLQWVISKITSAPGAEDKKLVSKDRKESVALWKANGKLAKPGTKVKFQVANGSPDEIYLGTIHAVDFADFDAGGQVLKVPIISIAAASGIVKINILASKYDVWLYRDFEDIPLNEYKGMWVMIDDPAVMQMANTEEPAPAILLGHDNQKATIKLVINDVPWIYEVPISSVKPTMRAPTWGRPYASRRHGYHVGDAVQFKAEPNVDYVVESVGDSGAIRIRPTNGDPTGGFIQVSPDRLGELRYIGRMDFYKGVVKDPHFRSPSLSPQAPSQDVEQ